MDEWVYLGLIAGFLTTVGFVPQLIKGIRTRKMEDVSLTMPVLLSMGMALWLAYGIGIESWPIIIWNAIAIALNLGLIYLKLRCG